jgi:hypothetical protein
LRFRPFYTPLKEDNNTVTYKVCAENNMLKAVKQLIKISKKGVGAMGNLNARSKN